LAKEKGLARLDFVRLRIAILRWPALDHVRDVYVVALEANRLDDLRQLLPGTAHERYALDIFVPPRGLADKHEIGVRVANAENDLPASETAQLAPRAIADVRADCGQSRKGVGCLFRTLGATSPYSVAPIAINS